MRIGKRQINAAVFLQSLIYYHGTYCPVYASAKKMYGHINYDKQIKQQQKRMRRLNRV